MATLSQIEIIVELSVLKSHNFFIKFLEFYPHENGDSDGNQSAVTYEKYGQQIVNNINRRVKSDLKI